MKREITDLLTVTLGSNCLAMIILNEDFRFSKTYLLIIGFFMVILGGYAHLIFRQLNSISDRISSLFVVNNIVGLILSVLGFIVQDPVPFAGYWEKISLTFNEFLILNIVILFITAILSINASLLYNDSD